jgi:hypothetical protein
MYRIEKSLTPRPRSVISLDDKRFGTGVGEKLWIVMIGIKELKSVSVEDY